MSEKSEYMKRQHAAALRLAEMLPMTLLEPLQQMALQSLEAGDTLADFEEQLNQAMHVQLYPKAEARYRSSEEVCAYPRRRDAAGISEGYRFWVKPDAEDKA